MKLAMVLAFATMLFRITPAIAGEPGYSVAADVPFGDLPRHTLDVYTPDTKTDETPVLVFLFGGAFSGGSKENVRKISERFAGAGTIVVAPNYRINTVFPNFVEDAAKAVAYVRKTQTTSTGDPRSIVLGGWSAGAYIAAKLTYDERFLEAEGMPPGTVSGFIGLSGPYWGGLCGGSRCPNTFPPETEADWPVVDFVDAGDPPMLLVWGTRDGNVDRGNHEDLAAAAEAVGIDATSLVLKDKFHSQTLYMMEDPESEVHIAAGRFIAKTVSER